jgi:hypothetical protein
MGRALGICRHSAAHARLVKRTRTHSYIIEWEHVGLARFHVPRWVWEGVADYVGIENRETFEQLREALADRPANPRRSTFGIRRAAIGRDVQVSDLCDEPFYL